MRKHHLELLRLTLCSAALCLPMVSHAQYFRTVGNGDLIAGFRKTGAHQGTNELVVNVGNITNLISMPMNTTMTLQNVPAARLTDSFSADYSFIQWSVTSANFDGSTPWATPLGNFPQSTLWYTLPRPSNNVRSTAPVRFSLTAQTIVGQDILGIADGATSIGSSLPGSTNQNNNTILVREPVTQANALYLLSYFMGDRNNPSLGDLTGNVFNYSVEQINPGPFTSPVRADLYEIAPAASARPAASYTDPITGSTTSVYYIGYFEFSPSGLLTFTREAATTPPPPPPPAPVATIVSSGLGTGTGSTTISFSTTNGASYTVIYTNFSGLAAPRNTWPALGNAVTGTGGTMTVTDSTPAPDGRIYSIKAQ